jgi:hypothetical protein
MPDREQEIALQIARSVLKGQTKVLEAARALRPALRADPTILSEDDFKLFIAIESETDDLPVGESRREWHPDVMPDKDREIARCEDLWRDAVRAASERILLRGQKLQ